MKISVVMPVYNGAWCVTRALESALAQTRPPHEIIVCDDGSIDGTADLVEDRFGATVRVLRLPHRNASACRSVGFQQATGDWFAFMDADDLWRPRKLERQMEFIGRHPEVRFIASDGTYESVHGLIRESWMSDYFEPVEDRVGDLLPATIDRCWVLLSSVMIERRAYQEVGGLDPEIIYSHDWDLWLRVLARYPGAIMAERLVSYYSSPGALSRNYTGRYRDNVDLMHRVARGMIGHRRAIQRRAAERAASLAYDLGLIYLAEGKIAEARPYLRMAARRGSASRRFMATGGALAPGWVVKGLARLPWLKTGVQRTRDANPRVTGDGPSWRMA